MVEKAPPEWLPAKYKSWDDLIAAAVHQGMVDHHAPASLRDWTYGSQHVIDVQHPLYGMLPFFRSWTSTGPHQLWGDETTLNHVRGLTGAEPAPHGGLEQCRRIDRKHCDGRVRRPTQPVLFGPVSVLV